MSVPFTFGVGGFDMGNGMFSGARSGVSAFRDGLCRISVDGSSPDDWPAISNYLEDLCLLCDSFPGFILSKISREDNLRAGCLARCSELYLFLPLLELLVDFYTISNKRKPEHIIIFRDGVSESQFIQDCKFLVENWKPKFLLLVAQKNHHTKFFETTNPDKLPPRTIIENKILHPKNNDFYLCAHAGMIGTTRPTHYHVMYDEIGFSPDELQELVHSLSYVYQRSTSAISVVALICYAHLAFAQLETFMKFEDQSDISSSHGGITAPGPIYVAQLPKLKDNVANSMFFC